jgi:hypothetical protein
MNDKQKNNADALLLIGRISIIASVVLALVWVFTV